MSTSAPKYPLQRYTTDYLRDHDAHPWLRSLLLAGGAYVALFIVVHAVIALTTDRVTINDFVCLAMVSVPQVLLAVRRGADVPTRLAVLVALLIVSATAIGLATMHVRALTESYSAWFLGAVAFNLLGLAVLGSLRVAWAAMAIVVLLCIAWAPLHGMSVAAGLGLVVRHVATLLVGTLLVVSLRRSRGTFIAFQTLRRRRSAEEEAARARSAARRVAVEQVLDQAGPTLTAIADGRRFTDEDRRQILVLEGLLRDQIRNPLLVRGSLRDSVASARRRGVNVLLMDEAEEADGSARERAAEWLAEQLDATEDGGFVGRVRDLGDTVRASAVNDERSRSRSFRTAQAR